MKSTTTVFGDAVTTTKTGALLITSVKALLTRRKDLFCTLTHRFDGQTDGMERVDHRVDTSWVIRTIIDSGMRRTRHAFVNKQLGAQVLLLGTPSYSVVVTDGEHPRRKAAFDALPTLGPRGFAAFKTPSGVMAYTSPTNTGPKAPRHELTTGALIAKRADLLASLEDPLAFDDEIDALAVIQAPDELAIHLRARGLLKLVGFDDTAA